jgi:hypothetical protein
MRVKMAVTLTKSADLKVKGWLEEELFSQRYRMYRLVKIDQ